jgi:hypothetical protein
MENQESNMTHVTFIHGIANKPPKDILLRNWEDSLAAGGLDLAAIGASTSMVYWADVMYEKPEETETSFESVDEGLGTVEEDEELAWIDNLPDEEKASVQRMRESMNFDMPSPGEDDFTPAEPDKGKESLTFEAIPLPWFIKRRVMKSLLRDVHHYLFNAVSSPRTGESYRVQEEIRSRFVNQLKVDAAANNDGKHVVVSHSMGTVISYDCLKNVSECQGVDAYMTVGCPLGMSEVHDNFKPGYAKQNAFPAAKVTGNWVNVYDRFDPVAFDARLANDYQKAGQQVIIDQQVHNDGKWRHSSWKYYGQQKLCEHLKQLLNV